MVLARVWIKGHLSMEKDYAQVQVQSRCSKTKPTGINEKIAKNEKAAKTRVSQASSPAPEICSFITRLSQAGLISYEGVEVAGGAIEVQIKSLLL